MPVNSIQFGQVDWKYANGLALSNNATTPNTKIDVATGSILDSTGVYQMLLNTAVTIDTGTVGLNGIDTGVLEASKVYAVYLVSDPVTGLATGAMVSLSLTTPLLPFGYSAYKLIGYAITDASVHFLKGYWTAGNSGTRLFMYDAPQATAVTAGAATTATGVALTTLVPAVNNLPVWVYTDATPSAASRTLSLTPGNATGIAVKITGQVSSVHVTSNSLVLSQLVASVPTINYLWSAGGGDAVAISVAGFQFFI
jgi:hypothetical protein